MLQVLRRVVSLAGRAGALSALRCVHGACSESNLPAIAKLRRNLKAELTLRSHLQTARARRGAAARWQRLQSAVGAVPGLEPCATLVAGRRSGLTLASSPQSWTPQPLTLTMPTAQPRPTGCRRCLPWGAGPGSRRGRLPSLQRRCKRHPGRLPVWRLATWRRCACSLNAPRAMRRWLLLLLCSLKRRAPVPSSRGWPARRACWPQECRCLSTRPRQLPSLRRPCQSGEGMRASWQSGMIASARRARAGDCSAVESRPRRGQHRLPVLMPSEPRLGGQARRLPAERRRLVAVSSSSLLGGLSGWARAWPREGRWLERRGALRQPCRQLQLASPPQR